MGQRVEQATMEATRSGGEALSAAAKQSAPVVTGRLRGSIHAGAVRGGGGTWVTTVAPHVVYARIIELGGVITAHGNYMLRTRETNEVFGHSVTVKANPYMARGLAMASERIISIATSAWAEAIGG